MFDFTSAATTPALEPARRTRAGSRSTYAVRLARLLCLTTPLVALGALAPRTARAQAPLSVATFHDIIAVPCDSATVRLIGLAVDSSSYDPCARSSDAKAPTPALRIAPPPQRSALPYVFVGGLTAGLLANRFAHLDADPGGYTDSWTNKATYPKKLVHGTIAFALTGMGVDLRMSPTMSALTVCGAGVAYEFTQGYVSKLDIGADCIGSAASALWRSWIRNR